LEILDEITRLSLRQAGSGELEIIKWVGDRGEKVGMAYLVDPAELPKGTIPFEAINAKGVYGLFVFEQMAVIVECSCDCLATP